MRQIGLGDLSHLIGTLLRDPLLSDLWVEAEVSAFSASPAGHWYITLKEGDITMRANCWKGVNQRLKRPTVGAIVQVHGRVDFYGARGEVQLIVDDIRDIGTGFAQAELERLMALYATMAKHRPIPAIPQRIGVVTSRTGAAYPVQRSVELRTAQGWRIWTLLPLMPDSELDSRPAGPVYWEGAVRAQEQGAASGTGGGKGFLELTGYLAPLKL
jgi:exodeoxyribonuclease VII large subunit